MTAKQRQHPGDPKLAELARDLDAGTAKLAAALLPLQPCYVAAHVTGDVDWSDTAWTPVHRQGTWEEVAAFGIERVGSTLRFQSPGAYVVRASFAVAVDTPGSWALRLRDVLKARTYAAAVTPLAGDGRFGLDALLRLHEPVNLTLQYCTDGAANSFGAAELDGEPHRVGSLWVARI